VVATISSADRPATTARPPNRRTTATTDSATSAGIRIVCAFITVTTDAPPPSW
jgi:hypothetical protein